MHAPDSYRLKEDGIVMNDTRLEDGSLCLILDYEKLLADVIPQAMVDVFKDTANLLNITIPERLKNGKKLVDYILSLGEKAQNLPAIITDIEMPEMSGFTVIKTLKANPMTKDIPIIVNSSMTGENNKREAQLLGAEGFIDKTKSHDIIPLIISVMK